MRNGACLLCLLALLGCDLSSEPSVDSRHLEGELALELRDQIGITIDVSVDGQSMRVRLMPGAGYDLLAPDAALEADGKVSALPETGAVLYSAKFSAPAQQTGPCGSEPVSVALALHREGNNAYVIGGLSVYCGADRWYGTPVRILRIAGELPLPR
jgi:hypothetical protein